MSPKETEAKIKEAEYMLKAVMDAFIDGCDYRPAIKLTHLTKFKSLTFTWGDGRLIATAEYHRCARVLSTESDSEAPEAFWLSEGHLSMLSDLAKRAKEGKS